MPPARSMWGSEDRVRGCSLNANDAAPWVGVRHRARVAGQTAGPASNTHYPASQPDLATKGAFLGPCCKSEEPPG
eukprot:7324795-Alexandrium_andersonii.AAC.1